MFRTVNSNDRYIPRRMHIELDLFDNQTTTQSLPFDREPEENQEIEFINYAKIKYNQHNYRNTLRSILMPLDVKVLNFFPPKRFTPTEYTVQTNQLWPVKSRKKPVINQPEIILDMPQFDTNICHHVADWSSKDCLATIFENEVHMWYPDPEFCRAITRTMRRVQHCVKWRPDGKRLAMGLLPNHVGVWDIEIKMILCEVECCVPFCDVLCLEWPTNDQLLIGCSRGSITLYNAHRQLTFVKKVRHNSEHKILNIVTSANKKFIASTGMDRDVTIWSFPTLQIYFIIECDCIVRALAWHPWKSSILALSLSNEDGRISLWNVNSFKKIASEKLPYNDCSIHTLAFNPLSGELVVSYFVRDPSCRNKGRGIIGVLTNLVKIVEEIYMHSGPILYLLWGDGGKMLASAGVDENLCLWDFFGSKEKLSKLRNTKKKINSYVENSTMLRATIR